MSDPSKWSVHELKEVLTKNNVDISSAAEKDDLLALLRQLPQYRKVELHHPGEEYGSRPPATDEVPLYYEHTAAEGVKSQPAQPAQPKAESSGSSASAGDDDPAHWSVKKLKDVLTENGVDATGAADKDDLLHLLQKIPKYAKTQVKHSGDDYSAQPDNKNDGVHYY